MRRRIPFVAVAVLALLMITPEVAAITDGQPDGDGHPMVGAVVYDIGGGVKDWGCSGSLLTPTVFLTAAHCVGYQTVGVDKLWVTFDPEFDAAGGTFVPAEAWYVHPDWNPLAIWNDIGVILLAEEVALTDYAKLPSLGLLDGMKADKNLLSQLFTNVGYGCLVIPDVKPRILDCDGVRRVSTSTYGSLNRWWLRLNQNPIPVEGQGGICSGDSGGPHFLQGTLTTVAVTNWLATCGTGSSFHARLDTAAAQGFILPFLDG